MASVEKPLLPELCASRPFRPVHPVAFFFVLHRLDAKLILFSDFQFPNLFVLYQSVAWHNVDLNLDVPFLFVAYPLQ